MTTIIITAILLYGFYCLYKSLQLHYPKITIELIPFEAQGYNVRSRLSTEQWKKICTHIYRKSRSNGHYKCQQCGENGIKQGFPHPVECHEIWDFDNRQRVQKLIGLISLCPLCHKVKHIGLAAKSGYGAEAKLHMAKHNGWNASQVEDYITLAKRKVKKRSGVNYRLDLTYLNNPEFKFLNTHFTTDEQRKCNKEMRY